MSLCLFDRQAIPSCLLFIVVKKTIGVSYNPQPIVAKKTIGVSYKPQPEPPKLKPDHVYFAKEQKSWHGYVEWENYAKKAGFADVSPSMVDRLAGEFLTMSEDHFVRNHGDIPSINEDEHYLEIGGMGIITSPTRLTLKA